ncbi:MAG: DUF3365 domain-containing protein [Spirochaetia bacterium]|nr:DUF3365 domain-containing protein [Spirochaetia bacterium]
MDTHKNIKFNIVINEYKVMIVIWSILIILSLCWNIYAVENEIQETAAAALRASIHKDLSIRLWGTSHGGVYVKPTRHTPPNPYLNIPNRDIMTTNGQPLTLMNPAYILRQIQEDYPEEFGMKTHLTSLKLLNPKNKPDAWEENALKIFNTDQRELLQVQKINGREYLRLIRPLIVEEGCLKCHNHQGYKVGDIRGGISSKAPLDFFRKGRENNIVYLIISHLLIWVTGLVSIIVWYRRNQKLSDARSFTEEQLKRSNEEIQQLNEVLELRVKKRTAELEFVNNELQTFSYSVSHDLRTPLRAIDGFSLILLENYSGKLDEEGIRILNIVRKNTKHMSDLIDDILHFSSTGQTELSRYDVDIEGVVNDVLEKIKPQIKDHSTSIHVGNLPKAFCDRALIHQVFENLVLNAVKFSSKVEKAQIDISGKIEGNHIIYHVRDNGAGFDMKYMDKLFNVFKRLHSQNEFEGTGIGLAIVKRIVNRHGGKVWAEGETGKGATFYFSIPLKSVLL